MNARLQGRKDLRVGQWDPGAGAGRGVEVEADPISLFERDRAVGQASDP